MNIGIFGKNDAGKSSFINSLIGFPIAPVSILAETHEIKKYSYCLKENFIFDYDDEILKNKEFRRQKIEINYNFCSSKVKFIPWKFFNNEKISIYDIPGIDHTEKALDKLIKNIENLNIIIFVSDAKQIFNQEIEYKFYLNIKEVVIKQSKNGKFMKFIIILNKYDDTSNEHLNESYSLIKEKLKGVQYFRWCSYMEFNKRKINVEPYDFIFNKFPFPKFFESEWKIIKKYEGNGDFDNFYQWMVTYSEEYLKKKEEYFIKYIKLNIEKLSKENLENFIDKNLNLFDIKELNILTSQRIYELNEKALLLKYLDKIQEISFNFQENNIIVLENKANLIKKEDLKFFRKCLNLVFENKNYITFLYLKEEIRKEIEDFVKLSNLEGWEILDLHYGKKNKDFESLPISCLEIFGINLKDLIKECYKNTQIKTLINF